MGAETMIKAENIHKSFGDLEVLKGIDMEVHRGEVVVLIGVSGSGKSTFLRCLNFLELANEGVITIDGKAINQKKDNLAKVRAEVGMVFQHFNLFPHKTVVENVMEAPLMVKRMDKAKHAESWPRSNTVLTDSLIMISEKIWRGGGLWAPALQTQRNLWGVSQATSS